MAQRLRHPDRWSRTLIEVANQQDLTLGQYLSDGGLRDSEVGLDPVRTSPVSEP